MLRFSPCDRVKQWLLIGFGALLVLVLTELGLRLMGPGTPGPIALVCNGDEGRQVIENYHFAGGTLATYPVQAPFPFRIAADPAAGTYRIFVLGDSAAEGFPDPSFGFPRILQVLLQERYPAARFEVVNAAVPGGDSRSTLAIARELVAYQPDLFVVYLGRNELGHRDDSSAAPLLFSRLLQQAAGLLQSTRLWQQVARFGQRGDLVAADTRSIGAPRSTPKAFQKDLQAILSLGVRTGTPVLLCTAVCNLKDAPPALSRHRPGLAGEDLRKWERFFVQGKTAEAQGRYGDAIEAYRAAARIDDRFASLYFHLGRCRLARKERGQAIRAFSRARDLDGLGQRVDGRFNAAIRRAADRKAAREVMLLETARLLIPKQRGELPGNDYFLDQLHFNFTGNHALALGLARKLSRLLPTWITNGTQERSFLSRDECARHLAYSPFDRMRIANALLTRRQPALLAPDKVWGTGPGEFPRQPAVCAVPSASELFVGAMDIYRQALERNPGDPWLHFNLGLLLQRAGFALRAASQYAVFLSTYPHFAEAHERLAAVLSLRGKYALAVEHCREAIRLRPEGSAVRYELARNLVQLGDFDEALRVYRDILPSARQGPVRVLNEMAEIKIMQGRWQEAEDLLRKAARLQERQGESRYPEVQFNLSRIRENEGDYTGARQALAQAIKQARDALGKEPRSPALHRILGLTLAKAGQPERAVTHLEEALKLGSRDVDTLLHLMMVLARQGHCLGAVQVGERFLASWRHAIPASQSGRIRDYLDRIRKMQCCSRIARS